VITTAKNWLDDIVIDDNNILFTMLFIAGCAFLELCIGCYLGKIEGIEYSGLKHEKGKKKQRHIYVMQK
jgi:hypothetical protein